MSNRPSTYVTRQGEEVAAYLRSRAGEHVSAAEVAQHFAACKPPVSRTTVYRQLDRLVREGAVRKYVTNAAPGSCFQYADDGCSADHGHLKCEQCGALTHMTRDALQEVAADILAQYHFSVDMNRTVFYGTCRSCAGSGPGSGSGTVGATGDGA
ncbi:MAG: transcriptional repressor [Coriobacteriales bacterium]|jgi:Fur family ferric uptake transcriptional regulator|nr:transcriptional repressor [Coriobacteriales bacterium]